MILEEKVKHYESQNVREGINKINDKMIRINKKHTTDINDVQHRLNIIERERGEETMRQTSEQFADAILKDIETETPQKTLAEQLAETEKRITEKLAETENKLFNKLETTGEKEEPEEVEEVETEETEETKNEDEKEN